MASRVLRLADQAHWHRYALSGNPLFLRANPSVTKLFPMRSGQRLTHNVHPEREGGPSALASPEQSYPGGIFVAESGVPSPARWTITAGAGWNFLCLLATDLCAVRGLRTADGRGYGRQCKRNRKRRIGANRFPNQVLAPGPRVFHHSWRTKLCCLRWRSMRLFRTASMCSKRNRSTVPASPVFRTVSGQVRDVRG
jgi:hypothetical protein